MSKIIAVLISALLSVTLFSAAPAHAEDSLYAFAEQPTATSPGFIQINHAADATWTIEGQPVEVSPPSTRFYYPDGIQAEVVGVLPSGTRESFLLQVMPGSTAGVTSEACIPEAREAALEDQVSLLQTREATLQAKVTKLRAKVKELRKRLRARR